LTNYHWVKNALQLSYATIWSDFRVKTELVNAPITRIGKMRNAVRLSPTLTLIVITFNIK
jgi:hypothetical protein